MKENTNYINFIDKIFERASNPIEQLQRIFENHPLMFLAKEACEHINEKLKELGYQLNMTHIAELNNIYYSCGSRSERSCRERHHEIPCSEKNKRVPCSEQHKRNRGYDRFSHESENNTREYSLVIALEG